MTIVMGLDVHREQITFDALGYRVRRGQVWAHPPGRPRDGPPLPGPVRRSGGRGRPGGDHGLALSGRGAARRRRCRPSGRARRDPQPARAQAPRQDRSSRRPPPARSAARRPAARVVDPARAPARAALQGAPAKDLGRRAHRLAATHPRPALSPRRAALPWIAAGRAPRPDRCARAARSGAPADRDRLHADRPDHRAARRAGGRAALLRPPPGRLSGAHAPLRHRRADQRRDPGRARRRPTLLPPHVTPCASPGSTSPSPSQTSGAPPASSPTKARRSCAGRSSRPPNARLGRARPTTTTTAKRARGSTPSARRSRSRASSPAASTTPCANSATRRSRRWRKRAEEDHRLPVRALPQFQPMTAADSRIDPAAMPDALDGLHRPSGRTARLRADPINHHVAGRQAPEHRDKAGRPRARSSSRPPRPQSHSPPSPIAPQSTHYQRDPVIDTGSLDR